MSNQPAPKKRKPNLSLAPATDDELDALSAVTPADIAAAKQFVERAAPLAARLLDAKSDEESNS